MLGCVLVTSGLAGIWRALRLGVVIDAGGVRVRGFVSREKVTPWSAIQSVDCAQIDVSKRRLPGPDVGESGGSVGVP
ncbi:PH domain-containing protein [Micromonospora sp. NPDC126480]|uniref:PH domain-containing protein n=1 Tax=Micromonospora sp. NPDC126480 TaxID=3155312 RepID=UPI003322AB91